MDGVVTKGHSATAETRKGTKLQESTAVIAALDEMVHPSAGTGMTEVKLVEAPGASLARLRTVVPRELTTCTSWRVLLPVFLIVPI
jgi:hypothetical protein